MAVRSKLGISLGRIGLSTDVSVCEKQMEAVNTNKRVQKNRVGIRAYLHIEVGPRFLRFRRKEGIETRHSQYYKAQSIENKSDFDQRRGSVIIPYRRGSPRLRRGKPRLYRIDPWTNVAFTSVVFRLLVFAKPSAALLLARARGEQSVYSVCTFFRRHCHCHPSRAG